MGFALRRPRVWGSLLAVAALPALAGASTAVSPESSRTDEAYSQALARSAQGLVLFCEQPPRPKAAEMAVREALSHKPDSLFLQALLAKMLERNRQMDESIDVLLGIARRTQKDADWQAAARAIVLSDESPGLVRLDEVAAARTNSLTATTSILPRWNAWHDVLFIYLRHSEFDRALISFRQLLRLWQTHPVNETFPLQNIAPVAATMILTTPRLTEEERLDVLTPWVDALLAFLPENRGDLASELLANVAETIGDLRPFGGRALYERLLYEAIDRNPANVDCAFRLAIGARNSFERNRILERFEQLRGQSDRRDYAFFYAEGLLCSTLITDPTRALTVFRQASTAWKRFSKGEPEPEYAVLQRHEMLRLTSGPETALRFLLSRLPEYPDSKQMLNTVAYELAMLRVDLDTAEQLVSRALDLAPTDCAILDTAGWVYFGQKKYVEAEAMTGRAIAGLAANKEGNGEVFLHYGDIHEALGNLRAARHWWERAHELEPNDETSARMQKISMPPFSTGPAVPVP